jgi:hypothetical protein
MTLCDRLLATEILPDRNGSIWNVRKMISSQQQPRVQTQSTHSRNKMENKKLGLWVAGPNAHWSYQSEVTNDIFFIGAIDPLVGLGLPHSLGLFFLDHTHRHTTVGRAPLDEWSTRRRHLYLTTYNTQNRHPCHRWIRTHDLSRRAAIYLRLRRRSHWDRLTNDTGLIK